MFGKESMRALKGERSKKVNVAFSDSSCHAGESAGKACDWRTRGDSQAREGDRKRMDILLASLRARLSSGNMRSVGTGCRMTIEDHRARHWHSVHASHRIMLSMLLYYELGCMLCVSTLHVSSSLNESDAV